MVRGRQKLRIVKETFHYIPILKTLQALLSHPEVLSEVSKILRTVLVNTDINYSLSAKGF